MLGNNSVGAVNLDVKLNSAPAERQVPGIASKLGRGLKLGLAAVSASIGAFSVFSKKCIDLGSDLSEVQNVVDVTFGSMSGAVDKWSKDAAMNFGLSETMAKRYVGTFGSMAEAFGFSEKEAYNMSTTLTGLAGDVASFYNISQDEAYTKLKSVFSGETEALKDLGIVMTQANLDQYALANGFGKTTSAMTEAEKVSLRYAFIQSQLANATGDFARTSDSWANQTRILSLQVQSLQANIGQGLIAILTPAIRALNAFMGKLVQASETFKNFVTSMFGGASKKIGSAVKGIFGKNTQAIGAAAGATAGAVKGVGSAADSAASSMGGLGSSSGSAGKAAKKAAKDLKKAQRELLGFDKINKLSAKQEAEGTSGDSGVGGGDISGGDVPDFGSMGDVSAAADEANKSLSKIKIPKALTKSLKHLKKSLGEFFGILEDAGKWALDNVLKPLGKWTISKLAPALIDVLASAFDALNAALEALKPVAQFIWEEFLKPLAKFAGGAVIVVLEGIAGAFSFIAEAIEKHPKVSATLMTILGVLFAYCKAGKAVGIINGISKAFGAFGKVIMTHPIALVIGAIAVAAGYIYKNWDKIKKTKFGQFLIKVGEAFKKIGSFLKKVFIKVIEKVATHVARFLALWNAFKDKAVQLVATAKEKVKGALQKLKAGWDDFKDKAATLTGKCKNALGSAWSAVKGAWDFLKDKAATITGKAKDALGTAWSSIKSAWGWLKDKAATLTGKAKNSLGSAYTAIKNAWSTIKDKKATLTATLKAKASSAWNWAAEKLNKARREHPRLLGWLPPLPYLAQGGFAARNTPQLAVIGDNRREGEIVSPESKLQAMADQAARNAGGSGDDEIIMLLKALITEVKRLDTNVYMDGAKITKKVVDNINQKTRATGMSPILL